MVLVGLTFLIKVNGEDEWICPSIQNVSCSCDLPHTLRCTGKQGILPLITENLRKHHGPYYISLLDLSIQEMESLNSPILQNVSLHGLVISSGILRWISPNAFKSLKQPFEALGLPNNLLKHVPTEALRPLKSLTRLDLSHNSLSSLYDYSFEDLSSLQFLDLCGNKLMNISAATFLELRILKTLHLQINFLSTNVISKLQGLFNLEELDISKNTISGSLNSSTLPRLPKLTSLNLGYNQITSVTKGALPGLDSLKILCLQNNMIDVLEDHAFSHLSGLTRLDLSHNRMVAVSEASLEHLKELQHLDVSHNFLRALTSDLVSPLNGLQELKLDDNDISMIAKNALDQAKQLKILTLSENPLNCDCNLAYFAQWLGNSTIDVKNKNTAVCATPPTLENGLINELTIDQLVCASDDDLPVNVGEHPMPVSGSRVSLQGFNYDGVKAYLLWRIDTVEFYYCDSLFVYEELGTHEVLLEHNRLNCNSTNLVDPHSLPVSMEAQHLQKGHKYRYCLVMVEKTESESALILGCSEILTLTKNVTPQILTLKANMTSSSILSINAQVWPQNFPCSITFYVSVKQKRFKQTKLNCSSPNLNLKGLPNEGPFKICAVISDVSPHCIWIYPQYTANESEEKSPSLIMFIIFFLIFIVVVSIIYRWLKHVFSRPQLHEQCFLPASQSEQQHSRYVKLQATTKL